MDKELVNDLFKLWLDLAEAGEITIGEGFNSRLESLRKRVRIYNH